MPFNTNPPNPLLAIATDLLAQAEAHHRNASRLEQSVRQHVKGEQRVAAVPPLQQIRDHVRALREVFDAELVLLNELERELAGANG